MKARQRKKNLKRSGLETPIFWRTCTTKAMPLADMLAVLEKARTYGLPFLAFSPSAQICAEFKDVL